MKGPDFSLKNRVALITGAGRGIGLAIAQAFAGAGCAVVVQDIDLDVAQREVDGIVKEGGKAIALGGDMGDLDVVNALIPKTIEAFGGLQILVNNAAVQGAEHWLENQPQEAERQWRVNMLAPFVLCQHAVPIFREQKFGRILNVGSIQERRGSTHMLPYAMSKGAMMTFTRCLAGELAPENITVNVLLPGYFNTHRNRSNFKKPGDLEEAGRMHVPIGRVGEPHEAAGAALLLVSPAGDYITGTSLTVDGGQSNR